MEIVDLLLELYRAAREDPEHRFEERALAILRRAFTFDSAIWGSGRLHADGRLTPHAVHLHRQPRQALEEWAKINANDPVAALIMANPGQAIRFHAPTLFAQRRAGVMRDYARRYGRQSYLVCGNTMIAQPDLVAWMSLYRKDADAQFSEADRRRFTQLMAHLQEALQINRRLNLKHAFDASMGEALAIADAWGYLYAASEDVQALLTEEWPRAGAGRLPDALVEALGARTETTYRGRALVIRSRRVDGLLFIGVRRCSSLDGLSTRERQVAEVIARGLSAKESGKSLGLAPATVRVHLQRIYEKLGVHSQAELAYLIAKSQAPAQSARAPTVKEAG